MKRCMNDVVDGFWWLVLSLIITIPVLIWHII